MMSTGPIDEAAGFAVTRLPVLDLSEPATFVARAAICAAVAGATFALWSFPDYAGSLPAIVLVLVVAGLTSALLAAPGRRRLSYLANASASSLAVGYVSTLHIGVDPNFRPIFHPLTEFAFVALAVALATALFGLVLLLAMRSKRRWRRS